MGCVDLLVASVGCGADTTSNVSSELTQRTVTSVLTQHSTSVSQSGMVAQNIRIKVAGDVRCDDLNVSQAINADLKFVAQVTDELRADMSNALKAQVKNNMATMTEESRQLLSNALSGSTTTNLHTAINQEIDSFSNSQQFASLINSMSLTQNQTIEFGSLSGHSCVFDQHLILRYTASACAQLLSKQLMANALISDVATKLKTKRKSKAGGVAELVDSITGPIKMFILAIVVILCVFGAKGVKSIIDAAKGKSTPEGSGAASNPPDRG